MFMQRKGARLAAAVAAAGAVAMTGASAAHAAPRHPAPPGDHAAAAPPAATPPTPLPLLGNAACSGTETDTTPFAQWGDDNQYRLVPGGSFSTSGSDWGLSGPAATPASTEPYALSGADGDGQLTLGSGGGATSPFSCVDSSQPTVRFMAEGSPGATLTVTALFQESPGVTLPVPVATINPGDSWSPTQILSDNEQIPGLLAGGSVPMALQLRASGGSISVDDMFVDPRMRS